MGNRKILDRFGMVGVGASAPGTFSIPRETENSSSNETMKFLVLLLLAGCVFPSGYPEGHSKPVCVDTRGTIHDDAAVCDSIAKAR